MEEKAQFELVMKHGHQDLVQAVAFNSYGDRCATGSVDGKIRVFNRHKDSIWRLCDTWTAHGGEILEVGTFELIRFHSHFHITLSLIHLTAAMAATDRLPRPPRISRYRGPLQALGRRPIRCSRPTLWKPFQGQCQGCL